MSSKKDFDFPSAIRSFNGMYKLESNDQPTLLPVERVKNFHNIIGEEVEEALDLAKNYEAAAAKAAAESRPLSLEERLDLLTEMSDWLGDMVVYIPSEARRWGLPMQAILEIIMASNDSKLGADGLPIYDERGKVMKGPGYWKPEPKLKEMLRAALAKSEDK